MYKNKKILALITARGGSKGIPRKNIKKLGDHPLIAWTIVAAKKSRLIDKLILSTDDEEIAQTATQYGCDVPFMRPPKLAEDTTGSMEVILHALDRCKDEFDLLLLLQPTSPFRTDEDIDNIIRKCVDSENVQMVSVSKVKKHPQFLYWINSEDKLVPYFTAKKQLRRQDMPMSFEHNGALYLSDISYLLATQSYLSPETAPFLMKGYGKTDIDSKDDWDWAEYLIERGLIKGLDL